MGNKVIIDVCMSARVFSVPVQHEESKRADFVHLMIHSSSAKVDVSHSLDTSYFGVAIDRVGSGK